MYRYTTQFPVWFGMGAAEYMEVPSLAPKLGRPACRVDAVGVADEEYTEATALLDKASQRLSPNT